MATTARRLVYDDLDAIAQERPGDRHEIIDGELVVTPSPAPKHQIITTNLILRLGQHIETHGLGTLLPAPTDIQLTPDNVLIPDLCFVAKGRAHIVGPNAIDAPPDLVVEILSPGTRRRDLAVKRDLYARFGVQEYWIVDPDTRTVTVLALVGASYEVVPADEEGKIRSRILPALNVNLSDVFKGV
jgi:Uma2 family endonuclease